MQERPAAEDAIAEAELLAWLAAALKRIRRPVALSVLLATDLLMLGVPVFKSLVTAAVLLTMLVMPLASRVLQLVVMVITLYAFGVWLGALPAPETLRAVAAHLLPLPSATR